MQRSDYSYRDLSLTQYDAIITAGSMGNPSPMHGQANYNDFLAACKGIDCDPRVLMAGLLFEDHFGGDPNGAAAAAVNNLSGIKFAGQPGATAGPISSEGDPYAAFATLGDYFKEYARTLTNQYIGPYFNAGDLANAWSVYIKGYPNSGHGQERVDQWTYYLAHYPPANASPVPVGVYGEDLIATARTQIGQPYSGTYDTLNGNHPWAYWCRAFIESTGRNRGLNVVAHASALEAQQAAAAQGLLNTTDPPEHGGVVQMDQRFYYPDGHTFFWDADKGMALGTLTDGTGVGYRAWGPTTFGYAGWYRLPGVVAARRPETAPPTTPPASADNLVIPDNPYNKGNTDPNHQVGVGGGIRAKWEQTPDPLTVFGYPVANETQALVMEADRRTVQQRTIQRFERVTLLYQPENKGTPWEVVVALRGQTITEMPQ